MVVSRPPTMGSVVTPIHSDAATHLCWRERTMEWGDVSSLESVCAASSGTMHSILMPLMDAMLVLLQVNAWLERMVAYWTVVL